MKKIVLLNIVLLIGLKLAAQGTSADSLKGITYEASYVGDVCNNLKGGIKTGSNYLGMANLVVNFNSQGLGLWKGGQFFINGAATHGGTPSSTLIGDFQVASNIEAGNHIYLHELWYRQTFSKFETTIGLQDLNAEFVTSENGGLFLNSSFGIPALISSNNPVSIFPLTTLGVIGKFRLGNSLSLQAAAFDGCPTDFDDNAYNVNWKLSRNDGAFLISELQYASKINDHDGTYKLGYYLHTGHQTMNDAGQVESYSNNYGIYAIADQKVWVEGTNGKAVSVFGQFAISPKSMNNLYYYMGGGVSLSGFMFKKFESAMGLAFAYSKFHGLVSNHETAIELFYKLQVSQNLFIQPDLQYIINPLGFDQKLDNAMVAIMRLGLTF